MNCSVGLLASIRSRRHLTASDWLEVFRCACPSNQALTSCGSRIRTLLAVIEFILHYGAIFVYINLHYGDRGQMAKSKATVKQARRGADQYMVRFPEGLRDRLAKIAAANGRSMNTEIVAALQNHLERGDRLAEIENQIAEMRRQYFDLLGKVVGKANYVDPFGKKR